MAERRPRAAYSTQQLAEFLEAVSAFSDEASALRGAAELAVGVLEAEMGAILVAGKVVARAGFQPADISEADLRAVASGRRRRLNLPGVGSCRVAVAPLEQIGGHFVLARSGPDVFGPEESNVLRAMAQCLQLTLRLLRLVDEAHAGAAENAGLLESLQERQALLERLSRIQRSISHRAPLQEVLDNVVAGASGLLGDEVALLRLLDTDDPNFTIAVSSLGVNDELLRLVRRSPITLGPGGRAIAEGRLVVIEDYGVNAGSLPEFVNDGLQASMAAPVSESQKVVGSLVVGSYSPGRTYTESEQEMLLAFAEHVSIALTDARTVEAMHEAFHDPLTGLANRALFLDRLEHALARAGRDESNLAVLFMDLDRFKTVNDSLGHAAGDELLVAIAERIRTCLRSTDTAARFGGDEFAILVEDAATPGDAIRAADRILDALRTPLMVAGREMFVTASVGVALASQGRQDAGELLRNADLAMYQAKMSGNNRYQVFEAGMHAAAMERIELEADLQRAILREEFVVRYQPLVELATGRVVGAEALVRWAHPTRGLLAPGRFIPVAEETGLIVPIGWRVLQQALVDLRQWRERVPGNPVYVTVNFSGGQLEQSEVVRAVRRGLMSSGIHPSSLMLEITETVLMRDIDAAVAKLWQLKELGVRLAIDDFGTGYSSLSYLRRFPIDVIKVDKSFVDGIARQGESALGRAIIGLARTLQLEAVAEGIEQEVQVAELRRHGCRHGQGYLYSKPVPADELQQMLVDGFGVASGLSVARA